MNSSGRIFLSILLIGHLNLLFGQSGIDSLATYQQMIKKYDSGKLPFSDMPELVKMAGIYKDQHKAAAVAGTYIDTYLIRLKEKDLYTKPNLSFISQYMGNTQSKGFTLFMKESGKVNAVLGTDASEYAIRYAIKKEFIPPADAWKTTKPDWDSLQKKLTAKFGSLGEEEVVGCKMKYYLEKEDWVNFGNYFVLYFKKALKRPEYYTNNVCWPVFEHVEDKEVVRFAVSVMKYAIETWYQQDDFAYDTYANLLYKSGNRDEAIEWETKAINKTKGTPGAKEYEETLEKFKNGTKTWKEEGK